MGKINNDFLQELSIGISEFYDNFTKLYFAKHWSDFSNYNSNETMDFLLTVACAKEQILTFSKTIQNDIMEHFDMKNAKIKDILNEWENFCKKNM